jgi:hypothetical protein
MEKKSKGVLNPIFGVLMNNRQLAIYNIINLNLNEEKFESISCEGVI